MQEDDGTEFVFGSFAAGEVQTIVEAKHKQQQAQQDEEQKQAPKPATNPWTRNKPAASACNGTNAVAATATEPPKPLTVAEFCATYSMQHAPPQMLCRGLVNTGNACFRNVVVQTLIALPPFVNFLLSLCRSYTFAEIVALMPTWAQIAALTKQFEEPPLSMAASYKTPPAARAQSLVPDQYIADLIRRFQRENAGQQEDAQEFLTFLLDQLHEEIMAVAATHRTASSASLNGVEQWVEVGKSGVVDVDESARHEHTSAQNSLIAKLFHGTFRCDIKKAARRSTTATFQRFATISLNIDAPRITSVDQALRVYFSEEALQKTQLSTKIEQLPPILILHLNRFAFDPLTGAPSKIDKPVECGPTLELPMEVLSAGLAAQLAELPSAERLRCYELASVVVHHGRYTTGGHYTCYVKDPMSTWRLYDDTRVEIVHEQTAFGAAANAYLLFFRQRSM